MTQTSQLHRIDRAETARAWDDSILSAPVALRSPTLPNQAGGWRLEGLLGEGTYSRVFAARPARSSIVGPAPYALKLLRERWQERPQGLALIRREAEVGQAVAHPHLVAILAANVAEPPYFVVMPRLAGRTLATVLKQKRCQEPNRGGKANPSNLSDDSVPDTFSAPAVGLPISQALWIARQTAEAVAALHHRGLLHNDIKPANVWVAPTGHVTLLDLSFARPLADPGSAGDRPLLGTVGYLAPEQIVSALRPDHRADIYSLGVMLYEMLTGRLPFAADNVSDLLRLHREQRPRYVRSWRPDAPREVATLVREMLAKDPLRRPDSMDDIIRRLISLEIAALSAV